MVNYYRDMWHRRSEILAPLTKLTSTKTPWEWTNRHEQAFNAIKRTISRETLLAYPDFAKPFEIHTDASDYQLGAVISQAGRPVAFYSRRLNPAQTRYTTTDKELLRNAPCLYGNYIHANYTSRRERLNIVVI